MPSNARDMDPEERQPVTIYVVIYKSLEGDIFEDAYRTREEALERIWQELEPDRLWFEIREVNV